MLQYMFATDKSGCRLVINQGKFTVHQYELREEPIVCEERVDCEISETLLTAVQQRKKQESNLRL